MTKHRLTSLEVLRYALEGALTERGINSGNRSDTESEWLDRDITELERRLKLSESATERKYSK